MTTKIGDRATVVHGYTLADIDKMAHYAAKVARGVQILDAVEAREEAWFAIVEELYSSRETPTRWTVLQAGVRAVSNLSSTQLRHHGRGRDDEDRPRFTAYWTYVGSSQRTDWTESIVERMSLPQILSVLTAKQYETIIALAAYGSTVLAAEALGVQRKTYSAVLVRARALMLAAWFEHETPHTGVAGDDTCKYGHSRAEFGKRHANGSWECRLCKRNSRRRMNSKDRGGRVDLESLLDQPTEVLTFAPAPDQEPEGARVHTGETVVIGSTECWCGLLAGHDWPHKGEGAPHPRAA